MRIAAAIVALLTLAHTPALPLQMTHVLNGHFVPGGPRYQYVPFNVSPGTESLTISYSYTGDDGASSIDPGLLTPGPLTLGTPAFRGYSGGSQRAIHLHTTHSDGALTPSVSAGCGSHAVGVGDTLVCSAGDTVTMRITAPSFHDGHADFIWNAARMTSKPIGRGATFRMPAAAGYLRAHLYAGDGSPVAITNPVYVEIR